MHSQIVYLSDTTACLEVRIPNSEILPMYVQALEKANLVFNQNTLIKRDAEFVEYVKRDVCAQAMQSYFQKALSEKRILPISKIEFKQLAWNETQDFEFSGTFEVLPQFKNIRLNLDFTKIDLSEPVITDSLIDQTLANLVKQQQSLELLPSTAQAALGSVGVVDVEATINGEVYPGASVRGYHHEFNESNSDAPLQKHLLGGVVGQKFEFDYTYPKNFQDTKLADQKVHFKVQLVELRKPIGPALTDDLVRSMFQQGEQNHFSSRPPSTVAELRLHLRDHLHFILSAQKFLDNKKYVMTTLVQQNPFTPPNSQVQQKIKELMSMGESNWNKFNPKMSLTEYVAKRQAELSSLAEFQVKCALLVDAYAKKNNIQISTHDFDQYFEKMARLQGQKVDHVRKTLLNPKFKAQTAYAIVEDKVARHILFKAFPQQQVS